MGRSRHRPGPAPALRGTSSRHELPVEEATAFIAIPGAAPGDEAVHESFLLAALTSQAPPLPTIPPAAYRNAPVYLAVVDEEQAQTGITIAFTTTPGFREQHAARLVLAEMLRERLTMTLRHEHALSYSVGVDFAQNAVGPGELRIEAAVSPERAGDALRLMREILRYLREDGFAADFVRARRQVVQRLLANALSSSKVADELEYIASNQLRSITTSSYPGAWPRCAWTRCAP